MQSKEYSTSISPSKVWLPKESLAKTVYEFMVAKFPGISAEVWAKRFEEGKVFRKAGEAFDLQSPYEGDQHIFYYREVPSEKRIPFEEKIIFQDENILVVDKPHFLPVHPSGIYVNETLVNRLKKKTGILDLVVAHRLDRLTAGVILCIINKEKRGLFQQLFLDRKVQKTYLAVGTVPAEKQQEWHLKNCLERVYENFLMRVGEGDANSESFIRILEEKDDRALFELKPVTGKKHQLRVHMAHIGSGIENDPLYPEVQEDREDDYSKPLQLLAKKLEFIDPVSGKAMVFESSQDLDF